MSELKSIKEYRENDKRSKREFATSKAMKVDLKYPYEVLERFG